MELAEQEKKKGGGGGEYKGETIIQGERNGGEKGKKSFWEEFTKEKRKDAKGSAEGTGEESTTGNLSGGETRAILTRIHVSGGGEVSVLHKRVRVGNHKLSRGTRRKKPKTEPETSGVG